MNRRTLLVASVACLTAAPIVGHAQNIQQRKANQQARIAQGAASGQLTPGETARLERQQAAINRETAAMRRANGGPLTPGEKAVVQHQQNRASRNIYRKKHNANVAKP